jgi:hypothetical protein
MAQVKYLEGDTTQYGYDFIGGNSVEVTDEKHLAKFRGNRFFEVTDEPSEPAGLELLAKHKGRGVFSIVRGDEDIVEGLTKADADAFNALSDEDKAAYVESALVPERPAAA